MTKAEARLEGLRGAGIDVNKWLQKAGDSYKNDHLQPSTLGMCVCVGGCWGGGDVWVWMGREDRWVWVCA